MPSLTVTALGAVLFVVGAVLYWLGRAPKLTAGLSFVSVVLLGTAGWVGRLLAAIGGWVAGLTNAVAGRAIGASVGALLFIGLAIIFLHDHHPKNSAGRRTVFIGLLLGALVVGGSTGIPALAGLKSGIASAAQAVLSL